MKKNAFITLLIIIIVYLMIDLRLTDKSLTNTTNQYKNLAQDFELVCGDNNELIATNENLVITSKKQLQKLEAMSAEQARLQDLAKKVRKETSGVSVTTQAVISGSGITEVLKVDTVRIDSVLQLWPTYTDTLKSVFRNGWITANKDSVKYYIKETVPITAVQHTEGGFFKPKRSVVTVVSDNPNVEITGMSSFTMKQKSRRLGLGLFLGPTTGSDNFKINLGAGLCFRII